MDDRNIPSPTRNPLPFRTYKRILRGPVRIMMSKVAWMSSLQGPNLYSANLWVYCWRKPLPVWFGCVHFLHNFLKFQQSANWTIIVMMMMMMMMMIMMMLTKATMTIIMLNTMVDTDETHDQHMREFSKVDFLCMRVISPSASAVPPSWTASLGRKKWCHLLLFDLFWQF